jgi:polyisoprenoid-binding protein YceI
MVISKVKGRFNELEAALKYDENASPPLQAAKAKISIKSIDTGNAKRDQHLRSEDFFNAKEHPDMTFTSKKIVKGDQGLVAQGVLTMRGVSKNIALPLKLKGPIKDPWGNTRLGIEATITLNRKDYGLTWSKVLETGGLVVGDEVEVEIHAEFVKQK